MMRVAVLGEIGSLRLEQVPVPEPGSGGVLMRTEANTICGTDLRIISGAKTAGVRPGVILGHELAGRVTVVGRGVDGVPVGAQVTYSIVVSCQWCRAYLPGREQLCENLVLFGYKLGGGLAEYLLVSRITMDHGNLVVLEKEIPATTLALAEPVSYYLNGAGQVAVAPGESVVVLGTGPIGLLHIILTKLAGATTILAAGREDRFAAATDFGVTCAVALTGEALTAEVRECINGRGADVIIVTVGDLTLANQALELVATGDRVNYFTGFPKGKTANIDPNLIHYRELAVTGGSNARRADVRRAVEPLSSGTLDIGRPVTHRFPLAELEAAVIAVARRGGLKVAVMPVAG